MKSDAERSRAVEAQARAAWPALARAAGLPEAGQRMRVIRTRVRPDAVRTLLRIDGPGHDGLVLKHAPDEEDNWFDSQIAAHRRAEAAFTGADGLGVPRLLACDRDLRAWLMEFSPGATVQDAMATTDGRGRLDLLRTCGRWMGHLHRSGEVQFRRVRPGAALAQLDDWSAALREGRMAVPDPGGFRALLIRTRADAEALRGRKDMRTVVHGDLNLRNLIVDGDAIRGVDFGTTELRSPASDMARMLVWHETFFGPVDGDPVDTPDAARAALLEGHGGRPRDAVGLDYLMAVEVLRLWRSVPVAFLKRGMLHHRRWAGVQRMRDRLLG